MTRLKNPSRYPVSSFGPELMALLIKGSREEVKVPCESRQQMRALQQRIHMLRGAMAREKHNLYSVVTRARTSQNWQIDEATGKPCSFALFVRPQDSQFADILNKAGVKPTDADGELLLDSALPPEPSNEPQPTIAEVPEKPLSPYDRFKL